MNHTTFDIIWTIFCVTIAIISCIITITLAPWARTGTLWWRDRHIITYLLSSSLLCTLYSHPLPSRAQIRWQLIVIDSAAATSIKGFPTLCYPHAVFRYSLSCTSHTLRTVQNNNDYTHRVCDVHNAYAIPDPCARPVIASLTSYVYMQNFSSTTTLTYSHYLPVFCFKSQPTLMSLHLADRY